MKEDPRFVCRREGHVATFTISHAHFIEYLICNCARCGKLITFLPDGTEKKETA